MTGFDGYLTDLAQPMDRFACLGEAYGEIEAQVGRWSFIIIQIDDFGGIATAIDAVLLLRLAAKETPVILASADVAGDDMSAERLALCDVTLKLPVSASRFGAALSEAGLNNMVWHLRHDHNLPSRQGSHA